MTYVLGHLVPAGGLALLAYLAGGTVERVLFRGVDLGSLRALARWLLGITFWVVVAFTLAAIGLLGRGPLVAVAVAVLMVAGFGLRRAARSGAIRGAIQVRAPRSRWLDALCALLAAVVLVPIVLLAVGPTVSWDADVYHLTLPRLFLEAGGFVQVPVLVYGHWPLATELLYAVAMALGHYVVAKLLHFGLGVLVLWTMAVAVRRAVPGTLGAAAGWLAAGLVLSNDVVAFELRVAYVEWLHAFALLAAVLLVSAARDAHAAAADAPVVRAQLLLAGIACGLMASVKVTGIAWVPVVAAVYLPALAAARVDGRLGAASCRFAWAFGMPVAALWMPWLIKAWWQTGNPVYPFAWQTLGGPWWSAALGEQLTAWQSGIGMGRTGADYLLLPWRVITAGGPGYAHFDGRLSPLWLAALPVAAAGAWRSPLARRALFVAGGCFVLWAASSQQMRFLVPVLPLAALAAGIGFALLVAKLRSPSLRPILAGALAVATLLGAAVAHARVIGAGFRRLALYASQEPAALYARAVPPAYHAIDRLDTDARILMIGTNHGFFCHRPYLADSFFEASQLADWARDVGDDVERLEQRLADQGVTHLLVSSHPWPIEWPPALGRLLGEGSRVTLVHADAQHRLLALHRPR